jgi:hypothetical protein
MILKRRSQTLFNHHLTISADKFCPTVTEPDTPTTPRPMKDDDSSKENAALTAAIAIPVWVWSALGYTYNLAEQESNRKKSKGTRQLRRFHITDGSVSPYKYS